MPIEGSELTFAWLTRDPKNRKQSIAVWTGTFFVFESVGLPRDVVVAVHDAADDVEDKLRAGVSE